MNVLDAAPATAAQDSLYGEESALHYRATSFTVVLRVNHAKSSLQRCEGHVVTLKAFIGLIHIYIYVYIFIHTYMYICTVTKKIIGQQCKVIRQCLTFEITLQTSKVPRNQ